MADAKHQIFLLEDDTDLLFIFGRALRRAGYQVQEAKTLAEARTHLEQTRFDIFLCDIQLGQERATTLLSEYGAGLIAKGTHIIVMSAEARYRAVCADMGIDFYLEKPVVPDTLVAFVQRLTH